MIDGNVFDFGIQSSTPIIFFLYFFYLADPTKAAGKRSLF